MIKNSKLQNLLCAELSEYILKGEKFDMEINGLWYPVSYWKGLIDNVSAEVMSEDEDGVTMIRNRYGKGEVLWCPSMLELGSWHNDGAPLADFMKRYVLTEESYSEISFDSYYPDVLMQSLKSGKSLMMFICNKGDEKKNIRLKCRPSVSDPVTVYGRAVISDSSISLSPEESAVILWKLK